VQGKRVIDASGQVVAPGFIDMHAHGQDEENQRYQVQDGVTTALELEIGADDIDAWYREREGKRLIHSGVSVGHVPLRMKLFGDPSPALVPSGPAKDNPANEEQISALRAGIEKGLKQGAIGLGFGIQYVPGASRWEILEMFRTAGRFHAPAFIHIRTMGSGDGKLIPDAMTGLQEIIAASAVTGVPVHMVHVTSSGLRQAPQLIQTILEARARGVDISTECYPYGAGQTDLASAIFDPGWQKVMGISYGDLQWTATNERLTAETFERYRKQGGPVILHSIPEEVQNYAVAHPDVIIASDGFLRNGKGHPRGAGTFARVLGLFVRERKALDLEAAIRKMSYLPAARLEKYVPAMKKKGRIQAGADADLVVFDPARVRDRATFDNPAQPSEGFSYVLVSGVPVVDGGVLQETVRPGRAIRAPLR
jgi:dihydroorotase